MIDSEKNQSQAMTPRSIRVLRSIVGQYIQRAAPVPSQSLVNDTDLGVSSATIRNEMAFLERAGFIRRPHISAGSVPSDKGYRHYVASLEGVGLPLAEQRYISHTFHQVERDLDEWLRLAVTLLSQQVNNLALVTMPRARYCRFKLIDAVVIGDRLVRLVLILEGARVRQQLMRLETGSISPEDLGAAVNRLNDLYGGLTRARISASTPALSVLEGQLRDCIADLMRAEDELQYEEPYLDGLHMMLAQPEFNRGSQFQSLMELIEHRTLVQSILPPDLAGDAVSVVIGTENRDAAVHEYSVVMGRYSAGNEASGAVGVIGPTRMPYARTISTVRYLGGLLSELIAELYGLQASDAGDNRGEA
jgi:heat-inducible transcriptional repressor